MENIKETLYLRWQMTLAQRVQFYKTQKSRLALFASQVPLLAKSWQAFAASYDGLAAASPLTAELTDGDSKRGNEFLFMNNSVNNVLDHSAIPEEVAAAQVLELEMNNHAGLPRLDYEAETAAADDLIDKFKAPAMAATTTAQPIPKPRTSHSPAPFE